MIVVELGLRFVNGEEGDFYPPDALVQNVNGEWVLDRSRMSHLKGNHMIGHLGVAPRF